MAQLNHQVVPIFRAIRQRSGDFRPRDYRGTGTVVFPGVLITCWHVVGEELSGDERYVVLVARDPGPGFAAHPVSQISQHHDGLDLAMGLIPETGSGFLEIHTEELREGTDFWTCGYPFSDPVLSDEGSKKWEINMRMFKGHVTAGLMWEPVGFPETPSIELSIPTPRGLSGAPIIPASKHTIAGIIYGEHTMYMIDEAERRDPETGEVTPEARIKVQFGLGHTPHSLLSLRGPASSGRSVGELQAAFRESSGGS